LINWRGRVRLPIATAEHREGVPDRFGTDRAAVVPKAIVNVKQGRACDGGGGCVSIDERID
jgi:hypothetical protein